MKENSNLENLEKTLDFANIKDVDISKILVHSHGYTTEDRKIVHNATNQLIQTSLDNNDLGECIHITGEMRALTDPFHRYICDKINQKDKDVFRVVYNLPETHMEDTTKILEWNLDSWKSNNKRLWQEELRTIYSIANRSVNLYALDTSEEIQYSVFGHKYILFNEKHTDRATNKHTWLLESEALNSELTIKAEGFIKKSKDVDEGNYRKFTQDLNSVSSRRFLSLLSKKNMSITELLYDEVANDFTDSVQEIIDTLRVMNFINCNNEQISLTEDGRDFIK